MAAVDAAAPSAPAPAPAAPAPDQASPQAQDSDKLTASSLEAGFMAATSDSPRGRRGHRDTPPPNQPMAPPGFDKKKEEAAPAPAPEPEKKPQDDPFEDPKPEAKAPEKPTKETNLRILATERDQFRAESEKLKARNAELEAELKKREDHPKLVETLAEKQKRLESYENELRMTRYESSEEYKEKWLKPYQSGWSRAIKSLSEFQVEIPGNPETGEAAKYRPATEQDFVKLYQLPEGQAWKEARVMFGDAAPAIMQHRSNLKQIQEGAIAAKAEYQQNGQKMESERQANQRLQKEETIKMWTAENSAIVDKVPHLLKEQEGDAEFNAVLQGAKAKVDVAYTDARHDLTPQERVRVDARVRNQAIAFNTQALLLKRKEKEISDLQERLKKYEGGEPGKPGSTRTQVQTEPKNLEEHFMRATR